MTRPLGAERVSEDWQPVAYWARHRRRCRSRGGRARARARSLRLHRRVAPSRTRRQRPSSRGAASCVSPECGWGGGDEHAGDEVGDRSATTNGPRAGGAHTLARPGRRARPARVSRRLRTAATCVSTTSRSCGKLPTLTRTRPPVRRCRLERDPARYPGRGRRSGRRLRHR
jgi:hypothetical protein